MDIISWITNKIIKSMVLVTAIIIRELNWGMNETHIQHHNSVEAAMLTEEDFFLDRR